MLKPSRKILRKEIKKDPLLETFEKIEYGFEKNKKLFLNVLILTSLAIFGGLVFINNQKATTLESESAFGAAMVAFSNLDYDNAKFQFESISSTYGGTKGEILANYYLGKIAYEKNNFNESERLFNYFLDNTKNSILVCGAIRHLVDISHQRENFSKSFEIINRAKKFRLNTLSTLEMKILEISTFFKLNDLKSAQSEIIKILENNNLPAHIKQKVDEFTGML